MVPVQIMFGVVLYLLGGIPWVVWGIFVRLAVVYQQTMSVNSAAHKWGYKKFLKPMIWPLIAGGLELSPGVKVGTTIITPFLSLRVMD